MNLLKTRPAETAGAGAGVAGLITAIATGDWLAAATAAAAFVPACVTFIVTHGGVRGLLAALWRGRP